MTDVRHAVLKGLGIAADLISKQGISKDRKNENQGFKFRGIDDVYNSLSSILVEARLVCVPKVLKRETQERITRKPRNDGTYTESALLFETVTIEYTVYSTEDGSSVTGVGIGQAMDSGDKALNKAQSAAFKYFWFQLLCIPTEGDNDADATTHSNIAPPPPARPEGVDGAMTALSLAASYQDFVNAWKATPEGVRKHLAVAERAFLDGLKEKFTTTPRDDVQPDTRETQA